MSSANAAIATAAANLKNLQGIPVVLSQFKSEVFEQQLTGSGGPLEGKNATYNYFGPVIQKYLEGAKADLMSDTVDEIGSQLQSAANDNPDIKAYFTSYGSSKYQGCIDMLSTWSGIPRGPSTATATSSFETTILPSATAPAYLPCPEYPEGGWADYGECIKTCQLANYQCIQVLASEPATWKCSC